MGAGGTAPGAAGGRRVRRADRVCRLELPLDRLGRPARRRVGRANRSALYAIVFAAFALWPLRGRAAVALVGGFTFAIAGLALFELLRTAGTANPTGLFIDGRLATPIAYPSGDAALWSSAFWPAVVLGSRREAPPLMRGAYVAAAVLLAAMALMAQRAAAGCSPSRWSPSSSCPSRRPGSGRPSPCCSSWPGSGSRSPRCSTSTASADRRSRARSRGRPHGFWSRPWSRVAWRRWRRGSIAATLYRERPAAGPAWRCWPRPCWRSRSAPASTWVPAGARSRI